ncbi:MAG: DUF6789 family protein [Bacteroidota bacterium]
MANNKFVKAVLAGIAATAIMTVFGVAAPLVGLPKINPAEMLMAMLGISAALSWIIHFLIGVIFASSYVYGFDPLVKINSGFWKGIFFGFAVFVFAQIMLFIIGLLKPMPAPENPTLMIVASVLGHLVYGVFVVWTVSMISSVKTKSGRSITAH